MKRISCLFISISLLIQFTGCKKYPEKGYHFNAMLHLKGNWNLKLYEVNGIDSTDLINYNGNSNYRKVSFTKRQGTYNKDLECRINDRNGLHIQLDGNREYITFSPGDASSCLTCDPTLYDNCYKLIFVPEIGRYSMDWEIIKLTRKELKLKSKYKNDYLIILSR